MAEIIDFAAKKEVKRLAALNKAVVMAVIEDCIWIESLPSVDYFSPEATPGRKIEINVPAAASGRIPGVIWPPCDTE